MHDWFMNQRRPTFYRPVTQDAPFTMAFMVRTTGDPLGVAGELRRAVAAADPDQPILQLATMDEVMADKVGGTVVPRARAGCDERHRAGAGADGRLQPDGVPGVAPDAGDSASAWRWAPRGGRSVRLTITQAVW